MFTIEKMIFKKYVAKRNDEGYVHPFYKTSFCRLYKKEESEVKAEEGMHPNENFEFLTPIIRELAVEQESNITHFYDVRTTEEFSQPAPEYALLKRALLAKVSPLSVKGMGALALPFALVLAENNVEENKLALVLCVEIFVPEDGDVYRNSMKSCCGFLLRKVSLEQAKGKAHILTYRFQATLEEVHLYKEELYEKDNQAIIYEGDSLIGALEVLNKALEEGTSDFLAIWNHCDKYGFIHVGRR